MPPRRPHRKRSSIPPPSVHEKIASIRAALAQAHAIHDANRSQAKELLDESRKARVEALRLFELSRETSRSGNAAMDAAKAAYNRGMAEAIQEKELANGK